MTSASESHDDIKAYCGECVDDDLWDGSRSASTTSPEISTTTNFTRKLKDLLTKIDQDHSTHQNFFYYLATAPSFFGPIVQKAFRRRTDGTKQQSLAARGHRETLRARSGVGQSPEPATAKVADEKQIYRIDHYLGKETVRTSWRSVSPTESLSRSGTAATSTTCRSPWPKPLAWKDAAAISIMPDRLRDMVPNHIMQLISLTAMEPPISFDANAVRDEQAKILHAIQPMSDEEVLSRTVRGQYGDGTEDGKRVTAYRSEPDVPPDSRTETFVAMKLLIDNWRWADVPFYLRTGKRMPVRNTHIVIQFRRAPFVLFRDTPVEHLMPNQLVLHIQPEEGISLQFAAKVPGPVMRLGTVDMNFEYQEYFGKQPSTGYERLLHDCMIGDQTLFQRADMVEAGWSVVNPVLDLWKALPPRNFPNYASGTWGPKEADELLERDGRRWRNFEK